MRMQGHNIPDPALPSGLDTGLAASRDWCCLPFSVRLFQVVTSYVWTRASKAFFAQSFYFDLESVTTTVLCDSSLNLRLCAVLYAQIFILLCTSVIIDWKGLRRGWRPWAGRVLCSVDNQTEPNLLYSSYSSWFWGAQDIQTLNWMRVLSSQCFCQRGHFRFRCSTHLCATWFWQY